MRPLHSSILWGMGQSRSSMAGGLALVPKVSSETRAIALTGFVNILLGMESMQPSQEEAMRKKMAPLIVKFIDWETRSRDSLTGSNNSGPLLPDMINELIIIAQCGSSALYSSGYNLCTHPRIPIINETDVKSYLIGPDVCISLIVSFRLFRCLYSSSQQSPVEGRIEKIQSRIRRCLTIILNDCINALMVN